MSIGSRHYVTFLLMSFRYSAAIPSSANRDRFWIDGATDNYLKEISR